MAERPDPLVVALAQAGELLEESRAELAAARARVAALEAACRMALTVLDADPAAQFTAGRVRAALEEDR